MYAHSILAVSALAGAVAAVPMAQQHHHHHRREFVWETVTEEVVQTIPVTKTVWLHPGESAPTAEAQAETPAAWMPSAPYHWTPSSYEPVPSYTSSTSSSSYVVPTSSAYVPPPSSSTSTPAPPPTSSYVPPVSSSSVYTPPPVTSSSSVYTPPPVTSSSVYTPPPAPTSVYTPPPAPTSSSVYTPPPSPATSSSSAAVPAPSGGGNGLTGPAAAGTYYTGDITYYDVGMGACGVSNVATDHVVAIAESVFDVYTPASGNPNLNPLCGTTVTITDSQGGTHQATIVDRCTGCSAADLDLSYGLFGSVTNDDYGAGRISGMKWCYD